MADPTFDHVFALVSEADTRLACHAFLCPKRKMAKAATLTIAQGFSLAYQTWHATTRHTSRAAQQSQARERQETEVRVVAEVRVESAPVQQDMLQWETEPAQPQRRDLIDWAGI